MSGYLTKRIEAVQRSAGETCSLGLSVNADYLMHVEHECLEAKLLQAPDGAELARQLIERHEGYSQFPRPDLHGTMQIGYGTNLNRRGLSEMEAAILMCRDVADHEHALSHYPWWETLSPARQAVLIDMAYCLGDSGLSQFSHMFRDLEAGRFELAADAMLSSMWAQQTGTRAKQDADIMRSGELVA